MYKCMSYSELRCYILEDIDHFTIGVQFRLTYFIGEEMRNDKRQVQAMQGPCKQLAKLELHLQ